MTSLTWKEENRTRKGKTLYDHPVLEAKLVHQSSELRRGLLFPSPGLSPSPPGGYAACPSPPDSSLLEHDDED